MGLGPRRVVDNQGKVRSGSAYFPFTVPCRRHSTTQAWIDCRRAASSWTPMWVCVGWISTWERFMHRHRAPIRRPRRRCAVVNPSRTAYLSRCPAWRYSHTPGRSVHARQPGKRFTHKPGRDSAKRAVADPGLRRYRPGAALAFGPKTSHGEHSDTTTWRS